MVCLPNSDRCMPHDAPTKLHKHFDLIAFSKETMRLRFFRRRQQHQKLSSGRDELSSKGLTRTPSDTSSGSGSIQSFDPNSYTVDKCISDEIPEAVDRSPNAGIGVSRRRVLLLEERKQSGGKIGKELGDFDKTVMLLLARDDFGKNSLNRPVARKALKQLQGGGGSATWSKPVEALELNKSSGEQLPRAETWGRNVGSLEACFRKESTKNHCNEQDNVMMDLISPGSDGSNHKSGASTVKDDDTPVPPTLEPVPTAAAEVKISREKSFEEQIVQGVSNLMGKLEAKGDELLDQVPDWSEGSSSGDFYQTATSDDDDTSVSGIRHRRRVWSRHLPSVSSIDEDDSTLGGCNPAEPCTLLSNEITTLLNAVISGECSYLNCSGAKSGKHRTKK